MKGLLFTYLLTYGGAAASLFNPFVGLLIYVGFSILKPEALWHWSVPAGNYSRIVAIALLIGWALRGFGRWEFGRAAGVVAAMIGFWAWLAVAAIPAPNQAVAWARVEALSKILLPCVVGMTLIDSARQLKQLAWVIVLCQGYLAYGFNRFYYTGQLDPPNWSFATLDNNGIAITMVTAVGLAFFLGLHAQGWWRKALALGLAALMAHVILFSMSRGGILALAVTGVVGFLLLPKRPQHYLLFFLAVLLVVRLAGPQVQKRFSTTFAEESDRDGSAGSRLRLWKACWRVTLEHPLTGLGPGQWPLVAHEYGFTPGKSAHTTWLLMGAELGFPGMAALLLFYGLVMARLWRLASDRRPVPDPWMQHMARAVIAALTGFIVSAQFVAIEGLDLPYFIAIIGAGVLKLSSAPAGVPGGDVAPAGGRVAALGLAR
jgi:putative inorganic carbon (HCO3(-)) transporter